MRAYIRVTSYGKRIRTYGGNRKEIKKDFENLHFIIYSNWKNPLFFEGIPYFSQIKLELVYKSKNKKKVIDTKYLKNLKMLN